MRHRLCYMLLGLLLYAHALQAQEARLNLQLREQPLRHILQAIERQAGLYFSYESSWIDLLPPLSFEAHGEPLSRALDRLLAPYSISWELTEHQVIILRKEKRLYTISGFIHDATSSESLIAASILDKNSKTGTTTNPYGYYSLTLPAGEVALQVSYVGYSPQEHRFTLSKDTVLHGSLKGHNLLKEVIVQSSSPTADIHQAPMGSLALLPREIRQVPTLMGEPDIIKVLQMTPGVAMGSEMIADLYVRGGNSDENLILWDGVPIYQVSHLAGIFSAFTPNAVKLAGFYKGDLPARYGERLSSVMDVRTKEGDLYHYHGELSLGLIAGHATLSGPLVKGRTSFHASLRRTWLETIMSPALAIVRAVGDGPFDTYFRYGFHDLHLKVHHRLSGLGQLEAGIYQGDDFLKKKEKAVGNHSLSLSNNSWKWGNLLTYLKWQQALSSKLFGQATLYYSHYRSHVKNWTEQDRKTTYSLQKRSRIQDLGVRLLADFRSSLSHRLSVGSEYILHFYRPEQISERGWIRQKQQSHGQEWGLFAEDEWKINSRWKVMGGLRLSYFNTQGEGYLSLRPRLSLHYQPLPHWSLKAAYAEMNQYIQRLGETYASMPTDIWIPVGGKIAPSHSRIASIGLYTDLWEGYTCSVEGYYKTMDHVLEFADFRQINSTWLPLDEQVTEGDRRSYGVEWMLKKTSGPWRGWIGYTLSWTDCLFPELNEGARFPFRYDNRHKLNCVATYQLNPRIELTAAWSFASGNHLTFPTEGYQIPNDPLNKWEVIYPEDWHTLGLSTSRRNNVRMPAYHRLDLGMHIRRPLKGDRMGIWSIQLYNAYCRMNPMGLQIVNKKMPDGRKRYVMQSLSLFPIIPSISYTYQF